MRTVRHLIDTERFETVFQPQLSLRTGSVVGVEALTRFVGPALGPDPWVAARKVGLDVELELATARRALHAAASLPAHVRLWINLGPRALVDPRLDVVLAAYPVVSLGVELTEHDTPEDDDVLADRCAALQRAGVPLAIDDVGSTEVAMRHVTHLRPDQVKSDLSITQGLEHSARARWQARWIMGLARHQGASVVAEGIESPRQLRRWTDLGAETAQGFLLGGPTSLAEALDVSRLRVTARPATLDGEVASTGARGLPSGGTGVVAAFPPRPHPPM